MSSFTNSPLATLTRVNPTKKNGSGSFKRTITKITIHHAAGVINGENLLSWGNNAQCGASWQYGIGNDGVIGQLIDEKDRAWTSSSPANDYQAVTIEVSNSTVAPSWEISDKAMTALIKLCIDICKRNNIPSLVYNGTPNGSLTLHEMFTSTNCPGPYIKSKLSSIVAEVNKGLAPVSTPSPSPSPSPVTNLVFKVDDIVQFTGGAVYNSSTATISVTSRGQSRCRVTKISVNSRQPYHLVSEDGANVYGWVAADAATVLNASPPSTPVLKSVDEVAKEVISGKWGNGQDRVSRLTAAGYNAATVQARVNQLL